MKFTTALALGLISAVASLAAAEQCRNLSMEDCKGRPIDCLLYHRPVLLNLPVVDPKCLYDANTILSINFLRQLILNFSMQ